MATQDQLDAKLEEVNTALEQLPAKVVEHLLKSDNSKLRSGILLPRLSAICKEVSPLKVWLKECRNLCGLHC